MDSILRVSVGPVGGLILRKKWRDMLSNETQNVGPEQARALVYELESALEIIMGESSAKKAAEALRGEVRRLGLEV